MEKINGDSDLTAGCVTRKTRPVSQPTRGAGFTRQSDSPDLPWRRSTRQPDNPDLGATRQPANPSKRRPVS